MFLFQKCLIFCKKIEARKREKNNDLKPNQKFQKQAIIYVPDLLDFLDHDYNEADNTLKIVEKNTNIAHVIKFETEELAIDWNDKIVEQADMYCQMMRDLTTGE